ncbi:hypothetical protein LCGC14_1990290 [marine sediment metagenome]|uniref:Uncharacterized protein n=1 Tax=marine sediment metagenome TaxID=412755 RepID=A0A0F9I3C7_9ZZZZ
MLKFNLNKKAAKKDLKNYSTMLEEQTKDQKLSAEVPSKNINLSMPVKDKDNTITIEGQIERESEEKPVVTEKAMETGKKIYNDKRDDAWDTSVIPINQVSEKYDQEQAKALKAAENEKKDTSFWDKYVGVQLEGEKTTISKNIPDSASQLQNNPARFKGEKINKMISASLQDADAMLFHIYATSTQEGRKLTKKEEQQIVDINSGKYRILNAQYSQVLDRPQLGRPEQNVDQPKRDPIRDIIPIEAPVKEPLEAPMETPIKTPMEEPVEFSRKSKEDESEIDLQIGADGRTVEILYQGSLIDSFGDKRNVNENLRDATQSYYPDLNEIEERV